MLPNFIIGGTSAAGTSFLGSAIIQHPDIYLPFPMEPECHYFFKSWEYQHGEPHYRKKWFSDVKGQKAVGERSSSYLFGGGKVAARMHALLPDVKLIFTLRNPIERAWANYRFTVLQGLEELDFMEVLEREKERIAAQEGQWAEIQPYNYTGRGMYARLLREYLEYFPREQMLLIKSELMGKEQQQTFERVFRFLGVDPGFAPVPTPDYVALSVKSPKEQVRVRQFFGPKITYILEAVRRGENLDRFAETDEERAMIGVLKGNLESTKLSMSPAAREYMRKLFAGDIEDLRSLVEFPLDDWR